MGNEILTSDWKTNDTLLGHDSKRDLNWYRFYTQFFSVYCNKTPPPRVTTPD